MRNLTLIKDSAGFKCVFAELVSSVTLGSSNRTGVRSFSIVGIE